MRDKNSLVSFWTRGLDKSDPLWLPKFVGFFVAGGIGLFAAGLIYHAEHNILKAAVVLFVAAFLIVTPLIGIGKARQP